MIHMRPVIVFCLSLLVAVPALAEDDVVPTGAHIVKGRTIDTNNPYAIMPDRNIAADARKQFEQNAEKFRASRQPNSANVVKPQKPVLPSAADSKRQSCLNGNYSDCY